MGCLRNFYWSACGISSSRPWAVVALSMDWGDNMFPVPEAFALDNSRIETSGFNVPLQEVVGTRDLSFNLEVDAPYLALSATADAYTWHPRIGHLNRKG